MSTVVTCSYCGDPVTLTAEDAHLLSLVGDVPVQCDDCREWHEEWKKSRDTGHDLTTNVFHGMVAEDGWAPGAAYLAMRDLLGGAV